MASEWPSTLLTPPPPLPWGGGPKKIHMVVMVVVLVVVVVVGCFLHEVHLTAPHAPHCTSVLKFFI